MHIWESDEWKIVFRTHYGHFEYVMMPFGFTNAHVIFQHLMNDVFCEYLDEFVVCYINDILILSKSKEEHEWYIWLVLDKFKKVGLYVKLEKCEFHQTKVKFLKYIILGDGIHMDPSKVQTIVDWVTPTSIHDIQHFFEFVNFYQCFIAHYCMIVALLTRLIQKD